MPKNGYPRMSHFPKDPFVMRRRLPSILLDSWEFRKIASEGSVLPNALLSCDVDEDGIEEIIIGTTEGYVLVVKPNLRVFDLVHTMTATIAIVMYSKALRQLVLVTLEGQCEVWNDFLVTTRSGSRVEAKKDKENTSKTLVDAAEYDLNRGDWTSESKLQGNDSHTLCQPQRAQKPSKVFHVPSNCMCGDIVVEGDASRLFLGSYDCHLYIYDLCSGACELFIFMHHAVTSLKCFSFPVGLDLLCSSLPSENVNGSIHDSDPKVDQSTFPKGKGNAPGATNNSHSDENEEVGQLPDLSQHLSVPLLFVATMHSLVLFPASLSTLRSSQDRGNESNKPLVLANGFGMRYNVNSWRSPRHQQEFTNSGVNSKDKSRNPLWCDARGEAKQTGGGEIDNEGMDRPSTRPQARSSRLSQTKRHSTSLLYPTTSSAISLDFYQATQGSGHSNNNKDSASSILNNENLKVVNEIPGTLPIDAAPSIALIYPLWFVVIRWHLLESQKIPNLEALFRFPAHSHRGHFPGTGVLRTVPTHYTELFKYGHYGAKDKYLDSEDTSFVSFPPSCSSSSSLYATVDLSELDDNDEGDNTQGEKEVYHAYVASSANDNQYLSAAEGHYGLSVNNPPHSVPSNFACVETQNSTSLLHPDSETRSPFQGTLAHSMHSPDPSPSSHVVSGLPIKETEVSCCASTEAAAPERRVYSRGISEHQAGFPNIPSTQLSHLCRSKIVNCIHSPVFVDVSVDRFSIILVAAREDGRVCVLQLTSDRSKADPATAGDTEQSSIGSSDYFSHCTNRKTQESGHRFERLQRILSLASLDQKQHECQRSEQLIPSRRALPCNKVRIPFPTKKDANMGTTAGTIGYVGGLPSESATQSDFKFSNSSLTGQVGRVYSLVVGDDPSAYNEVGGQRGSQPSHIELDTRAALPNMATPRELGTQTDILLRVECLWAGILDGPLVQNTCVFHVAEDAVRVVLVSATGKCYTIDPTAGAAVECSVSVDCSSFTLIKEPITTASDENSQAMGAHPLQSSFSSMHGSLLPAFGDTAAVLAHTMSSFSSKKAYGSPFDVTERAGRVGNSSHYPKFACGAPRYLIRIVCASVDELCIYSTSGVYSASTYPSPHALPSPLSNEFLSAPEFGRSGECMNIGGIHSCLTQPGLSCAPRSLSHLYRHSYGINDEFGNLADEVERALLLELGTTLKELDSKQEGLDNPNNFGQDEIKDAEDLIFYARQVLTRGYNTVEWLLLSNLERSV